MLLESFPHVPKKILRDIIDYYKKIYKRNIDQKIKKITSSNTPDVKIPLDFSGTHYAFLNRLKPSIVVSLTSGDKAWASPTIRRHGEGMIKIGLGDSTGTIMHTIEHEMFHYLQFLIQEYKKQYKNQKGTIGGLPPKKITPKFSNVHGIVNNRRTVHSLRPIEYYPDLLTVVRELHYYFYLKYYKNENWKSIEHSEKYKKDFFLDFLTAIKNDKSFGIYSGRIFKRFKSISKPFFFHMLKKAYDGFMNLDRNFDVEDIKELVKHRNIDMIQNSKHLKKPVRII